MNSSKNQIEVALLANYTIASPNLIKKYGYLTGAFNCPDNDQFMS